MSGIESLAGWDSQSRHVVTIKKCYVEAAGDLHAGLLLSQIMYWFGVNRRGELRTSLEFEGKRWIAKKTKDWEEECFLTVDQARRCLALLKRKKLIETCVRKFQGIPIVHVRPTDYLVEAIRPKPPIRVPDTNGLGPQPQMDSGPSPSPSLYVSKTTSETTSEKKNSLSSDDDGEGEIDLFGKQVTKKKEPSVEKKNVVDEVAQEALRTFNDSELVKSNGGKLGKVLLLNMDRLKAIKKALPVVEQFCLQAYEDHTATEQFWEAYWEIVDGDDFHAGREKPKSEAHKGWVPTFDFLIREDVIVKLLERAAAGGDE